MVTFDKNTADAITAARSVLLEVSHVLGEYRDNIVVIGGWVPELIVSKDHLGSLDVDLALDHRKISDECYRSIQELLLARGYFQKADMSGKAHRNGNTWVSKIQQPGNHLTY